MSVINIIKGCPLFYEFYDEEIEEIIQDCHVGSFAPGEYLFKEGEQGRDVLILLSGKAEVCKGPKVLTTIAKGDMLGELALVTQQPRNADVRAIEPVDVLYLRFNYIYDLFDKAPRPFALFFVNLSRILSRRLATAGQDLRTTYTRVKELEKQIQTNIRKAS